MFAAVSTAGTCAKWSGWCSPRPRGRRCRPWRGPGFARGSFVVCKGLQRGAPRCIAHAPT
eukprot:7227519-Alexandrium_andersonii.AAC.1